jgi:hypothetical protein
MTTLTISHYIYLSHEQRYDLHELKSVEAIGASVPVWFDNGNTSEPAKEVFCKYKITNEPINKAIISTEDGYCINIPQKITFDSFSKEFQIAAAMQLGSSEKLLDVEDGGNESLEFRQYNKIQSEDRNFNVIHFVEIKPIEILYQTTT